MRCESVYAILQSCEFFVHFLPEIPEIFVQNIEPPIDVGEYTINLSNSSITLPESSLRLSKSGSNKPFERREPLIDGSSCLGRFLLCHFSN